MSEEGIYLLYIYFLIVRRMYKHESFQEDLFESKQLSQKTELKKNALESIKKQTRDEIDSLKKAVSTTSKDKE